MTQTMTQTKPQALSTAALLREYDRLKRLIDYGTDAEFDAVFPRWEELGEEINRRYRRNPNAPQFAAIRELEIAGGW